MNNKYLNEDKYNESNKKVKLVGLIIMIIGICLLVGGIVVKITVKTPQLSNNTNLTNNESDSTNYDDLYNNANDFMNDNINYFNETVSSSRKSFTGTAMIMFGFFVTIVGTVVRFFIGNRREILAYQTQQAMPVAKEGIEEISPSVGKAAGEIAKGIKKGLDDK